MDTSWIRKDAKVILYRRERDGETVSVKLIESVAPQSFVVGGHRIRKDKLKVVRHVGYDVQTTEVVPLSDRRTPMLLALRGLNRAERAMALASKRLQQEGRNRDTVAELMSACRGWLEAEREYASEKRIYESSGERDATES